MYMAQVSARTALQLRYCTLLTRSHRAANNTNALADDLVESFASDWGHTTCFSLLLLLVQKNPIFLPSCEQQEGRWHQLPASLPSVYK
jgi:hypothetical protein